MTTPAAAPFPADAYRILRVRGRDSVAFLQGQMTQDLGALADAQVALTALLTPAGRVLACPWVLLEPEDVRLVLPVPLAPELLARLHRYVLRSKVTLEQCPVDEATAVRVAASVPLAAGAPAADAVARWPLALVRAGRPQIEPATSEAWIPQMLNLDLLDAISFTKGCYTGQEIVARTQHLGRIKRRMFRYVSAAAPAPAPLAALLADGQKVGEVVLAAATTEAVELIAVVNLEARDQPLALESGAECRPAPLPYAIP